ncbi:MULTISPECIES: hypothetical protein [Shewanella]|jgi:hypothetical protein|uniref:Uncharacterized protein n=1 Tax=Shewanella psychromarinicola TaxID=2487742 RepID=A0A3N4EJM8_9GAMM|nr:hypothetical protein [Shewanella psychromarinicola]AZG36593.1 hypothetical protein EGC80_18135 [Shewanella psychromarinicola]MCL1083245.1 hypothetical protein [Shewanella psychromarinicola]RPA34440.1 hypothetical protein EGC77_01770 [Shewanella psychromarinicola]
MFSLGDGYHNPDTASQLIVIGRFTSDRKVTDWTFSFDLFGQSPAGKVISMTEKCKATDPKRVFQLSFENARQIILPNEFPPITIKQ